jgi:hypothetical protein
MQRPLRTFWNPTLKCVICEPEEDHDPGSKGLEVDVAVVLGVGVEPDVAENLEKITTNIYFSDIYNGPM